jgi:transcriptional regulator with XRE-family HTH domain
VTPGTRIKELRAAALMTQKALAQKLGISPSAVGMYEQGRRQPDPETVLKLCRLFETTADWLLFGAGGRRGEEPPTDLAVLLADWRGELLGLSGRLYHKTAQGRRLLLTRSDLDRLWQAVAVAAEITLRPKEGR